MNTHGKTFGNAIMLSTYINLSKEKLVWAGVIDGEIHAVFELKKEQPVKKKIKKKVGK